MKSPYKLLIYLILDPAFIEVKMETLKTQEFLRLSTKVNYFDDLNKYCFVKPTADIIIHTLHIRT